MIDWAELAKLPWAQWIRVVEDGISWWFEGIRHPLPARLRNALFRPPAETLLEEAAGELQVYRCGSDADSNTPSHRIALFDAPREGGTDNPAENLSFHTQERVTLVPATHRYLVTRMVLPLAAGRALRPVVRHELERRMPFEADEVWFECAVAWRDPTAKRLHADVYIAPVRALTPLLRRLEALGARPTAIRVDSPGRKTESVDLLRHAEYAPRRRYRLPCRASVLAVCLAVLLGALHAPPFRYRALQAANAAEVAVARESAMETQIAAQQRVRRMARQGFLDERRAARTPPIATLRELTETLPEHTWLERLHIGSDEVRLEGETAAPADVLALVEASAYFRTRGSKPQSHPEAALPANASSFPPAHCRRPRERAFAPVARAAVLWTAP